MHADQLRKLANANEISADMLVRLALARGFARMYQDVLGEPLPYQLKSLIAKLSSHAKRRDVYDRSL